MRITNIKIYLLLLIVTILNIYRIGVLWGRFLPDFQVFFYSAWGLLHRQNPYQSKMLFTGFNYPINTLFFYFPFTTLPYGFTQNVFLLINMLCIPIIIYVCLRIVGKLTAINFLFFYMLVLLSFPVQFTLGMGQSNLIAYLLLLLGYFFYIRKTDLISGLLIGFAITMKPILIGILLFFLLQKKLKILSVSILVSLILGVMTAILFGFQFYTYYFTSLVPHLLQMSGREIYYNQGITGFVSRLTGSLFLRRIIPTLISIILIGTIVSIKISKKISSILLFSLILVSLLLIDTLSWQHHFVFLIFPFIIVFFQIKKNIYKKYLYLLLGISYILVSSNIKSPGIFLPFPLSLILSHTFYGTCLLFFLLLYLAVKPTFSKQNILHGLYVLFVLGIGIQYAVFLSCRNSLCLH